MKKSDWLLGAVILGAIMLAGRGILSIYSIADLKRLASTVGFSGADLDVAAAVAMAESGGDPNAIGDIDVPVPGAQSYGLWQINSHFHPEFGPDFNQLFNPQDNANAAYSVYRQAGYSFTPWTTFKTGAYLAYLQDAQSA